MTNSIRKSDSLIRVAAVACFATAAFFGLRSLQPETTSVLPAASAEVSSAPVPRTAVTKLTETHSLNEPCRPSTIPKDARFVTKNIEDIQPGDLVLARDEHGTEIGWKPVKEVYRRTADHLRHLTFEADDGSRQTLSTTDEHPFWSETTGLFVEAGKLPVGHFVSGPRKQLQKLVASEREDFIAGTSVFNFQVTDYHTYFVSAEAEDNVLLVHNADYSIPAYVSSVPDPVTVGAPTKNLEELIERVENLPQSIKGTVSQTEEGARELAEGFAEKMGISKVLSGVEQHGNGMKHFHIEGARHLHFWFN